MASKAPLPKGCKWKVQRDLADAGCQGASLKQTRSRMQDRAQDLFAAQQATSCVNLEAKFQQDRGICQGKPVLDQIRPLNVIIKARYINEDGRKVGTFQLSGLGP